MESLINHSVQCIDNRALWLFDLHCDVLSCVRDSAVGWVYQPNQLTNDGRHCCNENDDMEIVGFPPGPFMRHCNNLLGPASDARTDT